MSGPETARPTYTATATREADWWVLNVEGIGATQARSLRRAKSAVREMISAALDIDKGSFHVVIDRHAVHDMDGIAAVTALAAANYAAATSTRNDGKRDAFTAGARWAMEFLGKGE